MTTEHSIANNPSGFTLVELMVTLVVAFLVSAAVYASYKVQQQTHKAQMQVTELQQNLRVAMDMITREFVMAGFDPWYTGQYGIEDNRNIDGTDYNTGPDTIIFTADFCEDGSDLPTTVCPATGPYQNQPIPERLMYRLVVPGTADADDTTALLRWFLDAAIPNDQKIIAENIEFMELYYIMANGTGTTTPTTNNIPNIRAIRVTLVARADDPDFKYTNTETYPKGSGAPDYDPDDDNFRRRGLIQTIELRNAGLI
jgi:type IV pilus assembly protein PilW